MTRSPSDRRELAALSRLAELHGLLPSYTDALGRQRSPSPEALAHVLRSLGVPIDRPADAARLLEAGKRARWERTVEPIVVAWQGRACEIAIRLRAAHAQAPIRVWIETAPGERVERDFAAASAPLVARATVQRERFVERRLRLALDLPIGAYALHVNVASGRHESTLIVAPRRAHALERPAWGVFVPLHALRTRESLGVGDLDDLGALADFLGRLGGGTVATLPLLATFLDEPFDPSPYAPVSKLFWNELYLDVNAVPEAEGIDDVRLMLGTAAAAQMVDYRRVMALKRGFLEACSVQLIRAGGERLEELHRFLRARRRVLDYARFRAATEKRRGTWPSWPASQRDGVLSPAGLEDDRVRYHAYVQWLLWEQLGDVARRARSNGPGLELDLPVSVHPHGYDAWRERGSFLAGCSVGAPPDDFFTAGQSWGLAAPNPEGMRATGFSYLRDTLAAHMEHAGVLRIDHVIGLARVFVIPHGADAADGVYVRMPIEELLAVVCTESVRHRTAIVGEDLGTVPREVRPALRRHGLLRSFVAMFEIRPRGRDPLPRSIPADAAAMLGTHDTATFAAFLGQNPEVARRLAARLLPGKRSSPEALLAACWKWLAQSGASLVILSLEDLWLETQPQNVPGTGTERPNWRRRARYTLEEILENDAWVAALRSVAAARPRPRRGKGPPPPSASTTAAWRAGS